MLLKMSDKLIDMVQMYPILYNFKNKISTSEKMQVWQEIAVKLGYKDGNVAKAKWRNIRDSYIKYVKAKNVLDPNHYLIKKYIKWPWADRMSFLDPYITTNIKSETLQLKSEGELAFGVGKHEEEFVYAEEENDDITIDEHSLLGVASNDIKIESIKEQSTGREPNNIKNKTITIQNVDPLDLLFLSYAQTMKKFPTKKQIELKMQISMILSSAELEMEGRFS